MYRMLLKFISLFVKDKKAFLNRFDAVERNKSLIKQTRSEMLKFHHLKPIWSEIAKIKNNYKNFTYEGALENGDVSNYQEYLKNKECLFKNLQDEASKNLSEIIRKIDLASKFSVQIPELYLSNEEKIQLQKEQDMKKRIERVDDYYKLDNYKLPVNFFQESLFLYNNGMHKLKTLNSIKNDEVIIDVGFCIADSALVIRKFVDNKIIGFEPSEKNCEFALKTIEMNNLKNVLIEKYALGERNETLYLSDDATEAFDVGAVAIIPSPPALLDPKLSCRVITLDEYVKKHNLKIGLIKSDIEGFERYLLNGAINTIKEQKPRLLISIYHNYHDFYKIKPWIENLNLGYKFDFYHGLMRDPLLETLLIAEIY